MAIQVCGNCGLAYAPDNVRAGMGYGRGGVTYCCAACADGKACDCAKKLDRSPAQVEAVVEKEQHSRGMQAHAARAKNSSAKAS